MFEEEATPLLIISKSGATSMCSSQGTVDEFGIVVADKIWNLYVGDHIFPRIGLALAFQ